MKLTIFKAEVANYANVIYLTLYLGSLLPDWGSFAIVDADISSNEILDANQLIQSFVEDLDTLFDRKNVKRARTLDNIRTTSNTLNSLSSLLKRVHVSD